MELHPGAHPPYGFPLALGSLSRFLALYTALFAAFGVASPFLPALLASKGLSPTSIGLVLAAGTAIRLLSGPAGGHLADRSCRPSRVLAGFLATAALLMLGFLPAYGLALLLLVGLAESAVLAPLIPISDALTLLAARGPPRFQYGWVRGMGSAAFVGGTVLSGFAIARFGLPSFIWLNAALLVATSAIALILPRASGSRPEHPQIEGGILSLLRLPWFARLMVIASLVEGSHALHDSFAVIRWERAGIGPEAAGLLWSEAVVSEVFVFAWLGRRLLDSLGAGGAAMLAGLAGILRWCVMARTSWLPAMAAIEPLHGLTFALLHLACMRLIGQLVPPHLAARAQAFYGTVAIGATTAVLTLASGPLYAGLGSKAFLVVAGLCAMAVPLARGLPRVR
jgi:PPP family 3-phenylpropionic acid transporter